MYAANPQLTPEDFRQLLCDTAQDLGAAGVDLEYGCGLIDASRAVRLAKEALVGEPFEVWPPTQNRWTVVP